MRILLTTCVVCLTLFAAGCGGGTAVTASNAQSGPLSANWQLVLTQNVPRPPITLSISGFLLQSHNSITGSVELPGNGVQQKCAGVGVVTGSIDGQNVALSIDEGGSTLSLSGALSSDGKSMSGDYETPSGGCLTVASTGTWQAAPVPQLSGNFNGTLANSGYMQLITGTNAAQLPPIQVSGSITQGPNTGSSNAALSGTINAVGYPCFATAYLTGTVSGTNVVAAVFGFDGSQIGTFGTIVAPATISTNSGIVSVNGDLVLGILLPGGIEQGPCPKLADPGSGNAVESDHTSAQLTLQ